MKKKTSTVDVLLQFLFQKEPLGKIKIKKRKTAIFFNIQEKQILDS